jgi:hypothetical protein
MTPLEAYGVYNSLKLHFKGNYDYWKYHGKTKIKPETFNARKDKYFFEKLSKHKDVIHYVMSNIVFGNRTIYNLNTNEADRTYSEWLGRVESLTYRFQKELENISPQDIMTDDGQNPELLKKYYGGDVSLETLVLLDEVMPYFEYWDLKLVDTIRWPEVRELGKKYRLFLQDRYDTKKLKKIVKETVLNEN